VPEKTSSLNRAEKLTPEVEKEIDELFVYQPWSDSQVARGKEVREALAQAVKVIVANVPASADRSVAIRKLREARMDCNAAISFDGRY
jgi:hypothetical protein